MCHDAMELSVLSRAAREVGARGEGRSPHGRVARLMVAAGHGTRANGASIIGSKHDISTPGAGYSRQMCAFCRRCHGQMYGDPPAEWQGTDLSNDHPVAMTYPTAAQDPASNVPPDLTNGWRLAKLYGGRVECLSCHAVHDPADQPFLRLANAGRALCVRCHEK